MGLSIGIVGLPNVGKSTFFNALSGASALAANYPFATKEPNLGVVAVPDPRLAAMARREGARWVPICSKLEAEIEQLPPGERADFLHGAGLDEPGLNKLVRE